MMKAHSRSLLTTGGLVAALTFSATSAFAAGLDYEFTGEFSFGSFLDGTLLGGKEFEVHIVADTTIPDNDPGNTSRGEFLGPLSAQISIEGLGTYSFVNPISAISERSDSPFGPFESSATFGGGSTSVLMGTRLGIPPFFGDPNLLDPFPKILPFVTLIFNNEPITALGSTDVLNLDGRSPGGFIGATLIPESGSTLVLFGVAMAGMAACRSRAGKDGPTGAPGSAREIEH